MIQNKLSSLRKNEKITQQELGDLLGVTKDYISMLERGVSTPSLSLAKKIADIFCTTVDEIFFNNESNENFGSITTA